MNRKQFDCVAMKRKAQSQLRAALEGKTPEVQAAEIARRTARNPMWQELLRRTAQAPSGKKAGAAR
jgi:hypothetical protein